ncbi:MAG: hypothetical protein AB7K52_05170 [Phycisphaerales bacterium]
MTALKNTLTPVRIRETARACRGGAATHREATLLALHFRSASWTPCVSRPTLLAASAIARAFEVPGAEWDVWFLPKGVDAGVSRDGRPNLRRARLRATALASVRADEPTAWIMVAEERVAPGSARVARRLVIELDADPYACDALPAPVDPRAAQSAVVMESRPAHQANPSPDVTIDLVALGLIAPRAESW